MKNKKVTDYIINNVKKYSPDYSDFVLGNALIFYNFASLGLNKIPKLAEYVRTINNYNFVELKNSFSIAQTFFNIHNIKIDLKDLFDRKKLVFYEDGGKNTAKYFGADFGVSSYQGYDNYRGKYMDIFISNNIMDAFTIVHEVTHYMNQPEGPRSVISNLLTEVLSYGIELMFAQSLLDDNFMVEDVKLFICNCHYEITNYAYKLAPVYRILHVYNKAKKISKWTYNKHIDKGDYEKDIAEFEKYIDGNRDFISDTWNFFGKCMSLYVYSEYRKDKGFVEQIKKLNDAINYMSFEYCLQLLNIKNQDDCFNKYVEGIDSNIKYLINRFK